MIDNRIRSNTQKYNNHSQEYARGRAHSFQPEISRSAKAHHKITNSSITTTRPRKIHTTHRLVLKKSPISSPDMSQANGTPTCENCGGPHMTKDCAAPPPWKTKGKT